MKKIVLISLIISACFSLYAADKKDKLDASVEAYRMAIEAMDAQDYGKALKYSEDAILYRKQRIENQINKLKNSLSAKRVQAAGDHIDPVLNVLNNRKEYEHRGVHIHKVRYESKVVIQEDFLHGSIFSHKILNLLTYVEDHDYDRKKQQCHEECHQKLLDYVPVQFLKSPVHKRCVSFGRTAFFQAVKSPASMCSRAFVTRSR